MAFPGKYDFNYYKGDTFEFKIYPKTTSGLPFSLEGFGVQFNIATARGLNADQQIPSYAAISADNTYILCAITPVEGNQLAAGTSYVYDIEIRNPVATPYSLVHTLLNGSISVTDQVTNIVTEEPVIVVLVPDQVSSLAITEDPVGTMNLSWINPTIGDLPTSYKIYGKAPGLGVSEYVQFDTVNYPETTYSATSVLGFPIQPGVEYFVKVTSVNSAGENTTSAPEVSITATV